MMSQHRRQYLRTSTESVTMAGMFSLLHKSQLRLDANSSAMNADDGNLDFRTAPNSSPLPGRRFAGVGHVHMKALAMSSDRLPKRFRKRRCQEIHPLLRRSVCTLLLAGLGIISGFSIFVIDYYNFQKVSIAGLVILCTSLGFCMVGVVWLCWSMSKLREFKKKMKEVKELRESRQETVINRNAMCWTLHGASDYAALSTSKWPVKRIPQCDKIDFSETVSSRIQHGVTKPTYLTQRSSNRDFPFSAIETHTVPESGSYCSSSSDDEGAFGNESFDVRSGRAHIDRTNTGRLSPHHHGMNRDLGVRMVPEIFVTNCNDNQSKEDEFVNRQNVELSTAISKQIGEP